MKSPTRLALLFPNEASLPCLATTFLADTSEERESGENRHHHGKRETQPEYKGSNNLQKRFSAAAKSPGTCATEISYARKVFLLVARKVDDIDFSNPGVAAEGVPGRWNMLKQANPESTELLGDLHPLVHQLGSAGDLVTLSTASHSLRLAHVDSVPKLLEFLAAYQSQILIPFELPAIHRAHRHACRNETRELIAFDQELVAEPFLKPFATASRRVGQAQIKRLRPLRDVRVVQRYLQAVESGAANGWHTVVYGVTLGVYSLPVLQGVLSYERQTLLGFMHAVSRSLRLSEQDCRNLLEELSPSLPESREAILGDDELPRLPKQNF